MGIRRTRLLGGRAFGGDLRSAWLIAAPWLLPGATPIASWSEVIAGGALIALSLPRGKRSGEHYGGWDRYMV